MRANSSEKPSVVSRGRGVLAPIVIASILLAGMGASVYTIVRELRSVRQITVSDLVLPSGTRLATVTEAGPIALAPSGQHLALVASDAQQSALYVRELATGRSRKIEGTSGATHPFWSPDETRIGFFADDKLKTIALGGGGAAVLCDAAGGSGGAWNRRGLIVFASAGALLRVAEKGGRPEPVITPPAGSVARSPHFLPDEVHFLFTEQAAGATPSLFAGSLNQPAFRKLVRTDASNSAYASGTLLLRRGTALVGQEFGAGELATTGPERTIAGSIEGDGAFANYSASLDGRLVYRATGEEWLRFVVHWTR